MSWLYYPALAVWWLLSLPPLRAMYLISDCVIYPLAYHIIRYRRQLVRRQLTESLPELDLAAVLEVERRFYHTLCDYIVETLKLMTISPREIKRRVRFTGMDNLQQVMLDEGKTINVAYLGHIGNWEWMSSAVLNMRPDFSFAQVYHKLHNPVLDRLMLRIRQRLGGQCVTMSGALRHVIQARKERRNEIIGFIADQCPKWEAIRQWCRFLHHDTPFLTGAEVIARRTDAVICYLDITRPRRGHYVADVNILTTTPCDHQDFEITERYANLLERSVRRNPHLWLWTHNRWKRTRPEWERRLRPRHTPGSPNA